MTRKSVTQTHHISYEPEVTVKTFKGEHWIITLLTRRKKVSRGFISALKGWIILNEMGAEEL